MNVRQWSSLLWLLLLLLLLLQLVL